MTGDNGTNDGSAPARERRGLSSSQRILLGLGLGIGCGLFFGERAGWLEVVGDVYLGLLQMTVLPYIVLALISKIPRLGTAGGAGFAWKVVAVLLALWTVGGLTIVALPHALPDWSTASFFSPSSVHTADAESLIALYVPINPFDSLAKGTVPAVVLFCVCLGIALARVPHHERLLDSLDVVTDAMGRINSYLARFMPLGVFAIAAATSGTMTLDQLDRLQGYVLLYFAAAFLLAFVVVPGMIAAVTPFTWRDVMRSTRSAMITAFATGKLFVVLPMLIESVGELYKSRGLDHDEAVARAQVLVPLGYAFPSLGKMLILLFVAFAGWYVGEPLDMPQYGQLLGAGTLSAFGSPLAAIPFLLDVMHLPEDEFQLFVAFGVVTSRLGDLVGAIHLVALATVGTFWATHGLKRSPVAWIKLGVVSVVTCALLMLGINRFLSWSLEGAYHLDRAATGMSLSVTPQPFVVLDRAEPNPVPLREGQSVLDRIRERGILRVGFAEDAMPFCFRNDRDELVGFDVDMVHELARDLRVDLELVPLERHDAEAQLAADACDIIIGAVWGTLDVYVTTTATRPYLELTLAIVVPDYVQLRTMEDLENAGADLTVFLIQSDYFEARVRDALPEATIVPLATEAEFFAREHGGNEILFSTLEEGSAWCVLHPEYKALDPLPRPGRAPLVYLIAHRDEPLRRLLDAWLDLRRSSGQLDELYEYWVLGRGAETKEPRWSVLTDVLHWGE